MSTHAAETRKQQRARAERRRRLGDLGIAVTLAAITVGALIAISQAGVSDPPAPGKPNELQSEVSGRFAGIPQRGDTLGRADAPVTLVEFADLQCPFCAQYDRAVLPAIIDRYVRDGSLKLVFRPLRFLGPDSVTAAAAAGAAAEQDRLWQFVDAFYRRQGQEGSGYVTPEFLSETATAVPGLDGSELIPGSNRLVRRAEGEARVYGIDSTPSFLVGLSGKPLSRMDVPALEPKAFTSQLDPIVAASR